MPRDLAKIYITEKAERSLKGGHPWVYGEEVTSVSGEYEQGGTVDVFSKKGSWLGAGFVNDLSKIRVRIISRNTNDTFDASFWERRVKYALAYRKHVCGDLSVCRLIYGESDGFPGFTVDKYNDIIVTQVLCLGIEKIKDVIYRILTEALALENCKVKCIIERCDVPVREKEGLSQFKGFYDPEWMKNARGGRKLTAEDAKTRIFENGIYYDIDCLEGQKTGYFLDQKLNRKAAGEISKGLKVLDCFCNIGGFSLNCARSGAISVTGADISPLACSNASSNASINGLANAEFITVDVFDYLTELAGKKQHPYDMIILDPPAFTKSRETAKNAYKGYKDINYRAMRILPRGGYLVSCSCSHFMTVEMFERMLQDAATDAGVSLKIVEKRFAAPDHPVTLGIPETEYLKCYIMQII